jgi:hypothetical protein
LQALPIADHERLFVRQVEIDGAPEPGALERPNRAGVLDIRLR